MIDVSSERDRRLRIWHSISNEDLDNLEPKYLRNLGITAALRVFGSIRLIQLAQKSDPTALPLQSFIRGIITPMIYQMTG
jgi:hypothetical protein